MTRCNNYCGINVCPVVMVLRTEDADNPADDVLENVNMLDDTKAKENIEKKKAKPVYVAYDDDEFDEHGNPRGERSILQQYDEEIEVRAFTRLS